MIFVYHQSYEHGVIGLVANRLKDEFYRPVVVLAPREDYWVASARSIDEFSMIEAVHLLKNFLGEHGGHRLAAGFTVRANRLEKVKQKMISKAEKSLDQTQLKPKLKIEAEVKLNDLNFALFQELEKFAPFGIGNPEPIFTCHGLKIREIKRLGAENQHLKFKINGFEAIGFGMGDLLPDLSMAKPVSLAFNLFLNQWNKQKKLELRLKDIKTNELQNNGEKDKI